MPTERDAYLASLGATGVSPTAQPQQSAKKSPTMAELIRVLLFAKKKPVISSKEEREAQRVREQEPDVMP